MCEEHIQAPIIIDLYCSEQPKGLAVIDDGCVMWWQEDAVAKAAGNTDAIVHPLMDMVRKRSTMPTEAASFFAALLWPHNWNRCGCELLTHPYMEAMTGLMEKHTGRPGMLPLLHSVASAFVAHDVLRSWPAASEFCLRASASASLHPVS